MENKRSNAKSDLMGVSAAGVSSIAQKELSPLKRFINSSVFLVICIEIVLVAVFSDCSDGLFFSTDNLLNVGMNAAQMMILAFGITFLMTAGFFDMSIGMNVIFSSVVAAKVFKFVAGTPEQITAGIYPNLELAVIATIVTAIVVGILGGVMNGFFVTELHLPAFIATLATMNIFQGIAFVICNGAMETDIPRDFQTYFGHAKLFDVIPYPLILALIIGLILHFIMKYTKFGLYVRALGSNSESARRGGIDIKKYTYAVYILMGALAAVAGLLDIARFATTNPNGHKTDSLLAIMAVVMGRTSLKGGIGSVSGTIIAALIPVTLQIGLIVIRVNTYYQLVVTGIFVVFAVYIDYCRNIKAPRNQ